MQNIKNIKGSALNYVLYHKNCNDGFGAAWVAWQALGNQAKYIPCLLYTSDAADE